MKYLSPEDIEMIQHSNGTGFTKAKLAEWGLPWPAPKGWRKKILRELGFRYDPKPSHCGQPKAARLSHAASTAMRWMYRDAPAEMTIEEARAEVRRRWGTEIEKELL